MECHRVQSLLVAWQDGQLAPGLARRITAHLTPCAACSALERRLRACTPEPSLPLPEFIERRFQDRLDEVLRAARESTSRPRAAHRAS